jgi:hypothetical protein
MSIAGYQKTVRVKTTAESTWYDFPATSATLNLSGDVLDDTTILSTGFRSKLLGLRDWSISIPSNFETTNTAFARVRSAWLGRTKLDVEYQPTGTTTVGFGGVAWVENFSHSGDVGGLETVDITLVAESQLSTL